MSDIKDYSGEENMIKDRETVADYIGALKDLYLINNQPAYSINYRSSKRVGKSSKRHFVDPSLNCAVLGLTQEKLINDLDTMGLLFEALAERDLKIYMEYLNGNLYHFRDNTSGDEVDAILEFSDGEYAAVEIKLGFNSIDSAKKSLINFYDNVKKKPKFMCVVVGLLNAIMYDKENNIFVVPITALKP